MAPKIVMVNYLNSKPFELGLLESSSVFKPEIILATPRICAELFKSGSVDIALVPIGALTELSNYCIVSDYCISCDGDVRTVCIFSNQDIRKCKKVYLDSHSRTSFLLTKLLMEEYHHLQPVYETIDINNINLDEDDAILMIGDKVFEYENRFSFKYDLGAMWKEWTGLPFVFAVWIAKLEVSIETLNSLNASLKFGIEHLDVIIKRESSENLDLYYYFNHNIQFGLDKQKRHSMDFFLSKVSEYQTDVFKHI